MAADPCRRPTSVSVVVIAYNQGDLVGDVLEALTRQTRQESFEVVVVDNNSTDDTAEVARQWTSRLPPLSRVVTCRDGQGPSYARNRGIEESSGDLIAFLDGDDVPAPEWLERMVEASERYDVVGGQLEKTLLNKADLRGTESAFHEVGRISLSPLPFVLGANIAVWRKVFDSVGGWPTDFRSSEDLYLCWRAQLAGFSVGVAKDAWVHYRVPPSLWVAARKGYLYGQDHARLRWVFGDRATRAGTWRDVVTWFYAMAWVVPRTPFDRAARATVVRESAAKLGRLRGSLRYRVFVF